MPAHPMLILGGVVAGVILAAYGATQVPGIVDTVRDGAAVHDLSQVAAAQSAAETVTGHPASTMEELRTGVVDGQQVGVKVRPSADHDLELLPGTDPGSWCAVVQSASGTWFARSSSNSKAMDGDTRQEAATAAGCTTGGGGTGQEGRLVLTLNTRATGCKAPGVFIVPGEGGARIDWGDGTTTEADPAATLQRHDYATPGTYTVTVTGRVPAFHVNDPQVRNSTLNTMATTNACLTAVESWDDNLGLTDLGMAFARAANLTRVPDHLPAGVTSLYRAFELAKAFNQDLSGWDVSQVTNMAYLFYGASVFNQPLASWDVSNVTSMNSMFAAAKAFNQDISGWDVSGVNDMTRMFNSASAFNQDLSGWDVSDVTNMSYMFASALAFNQPLGDWNVSKVMNMSYMFSSAVAFNQDISRWDVSRVRNTQGMFRSATMFNKPLSGWDVSNVIQMAEMFYSARAFNQDLSGWNVSKVIDMTEMFAYAYAFNQDISGWDVRKVGLHEGFAQDVSILQDKLPRFG